MQSSIGHAACRFVPMGFQLKSKVRIEGSEVHVTYVN